MLPKTRELLHMSFQLPGGVSRQAEKVLWQRGILTWNDFRLRGRKIFSPRRTERLLEAIRTAEGLVATCSLRKLIRSAPPIWVLRLGPLLLPRAAFLDIETAGLAREDPPVTAVVFYRNCLSFFVQSINLDLLPKHLRPLKLLVTFHGRRFDLPRLRYHLGLRYRGQHIDLAKLVRACGLKGSLKTILRQLGFPWPEGIPTRGEDAPKLWNSYCQGDLGALRCLLSYNAYDVVALPWLWVALYNRSLQNWPLFRPLSPPQMPEIVAAVEEWMRLHGLKC
jgi:uncharacterized protein YprB with RNaseH-like and TPR domain